MEKAEMIQRYSLLPYSHAIWQALKTNSDAEYFQVRISWDTQQIDSTRVVTAMRTALMNHPIFSAEIDEDGMHYAGDRTNILTGPYHQVEHGENGEEGYLTVRANQLLGDGISRQIAAEDFVRAYEGLSLEKDDYWACLAAIEARKSAEGYKQHSEALANEFGVVDYPLALGEDLNGIEQTEGILDVDLYALEPCVARFAEEWKLPLNGQMVLASAMATMDMENTAVAGLTWAYHGRETEQEQHVFGSLHRDVPIRIGRESLPEMIRQTRNGLRRGIAMSEVPYTLTAPADSPWHRAVNVIVEPAWEDVHTMLPDGIRMEGIYSPSAMAYLDLEVYESPLRMRLHYNSARFSKTKMEQYSRKIKENLAQLLSTHK